MRNDQVFKIAVLGGDGIGPEVTAPTVDLLDAAVGRVEGLSLDYQELEAGASLYARTGESFPEESFEAAKAADAMLLGAMGLPDVRGPDGREMAPQLELRERLGLFAGVRPVRTWPGLPAPLADPRAQRLDFVLIRESTEGLFAGRTTGRVEDDKVAHDCLTISRDGSERLFDFAFDLARSRANGSEKRAVTCIDKANVFRSFGFFRKIFDERAAAHPDVEARHMYVDAAALNMVRQPWAFDVLVTENMFGDILSDLGAGLMGGMGMAPSADIGAEHALFQPCHGSAPDIVGQGKANPTATILSGAMMLDWLGRRQDCAPAVEAGGRLVAAVEAAYADGSLRPYEVGGEAGTAAIAERIGEALAGAG